MNEEELGGLADGLEEGRVATSAKTESESAFEQYLSGSRAEWTRISEADSPQPDYAVQYAEGTCVFEVKEFGDPKGEQAEELKRVGGGFDPCPPVRKKIYRSRRQFGEYKSHPCVVVLWNSKSILRDIRPEVVMASAFGQYFHTEAGLPGGLGAPSYRFNGPAELRPDNDTRISAIVILTRYQLNHLWVEVDRQLDARKQRGEKIWCGDWFDLLQQVSRERPVTYSYEGTIRTITIENPYARIPFPPDLFAGPFDQRWRKDSGRFTLVFMGSELERPRKEGVPFNFL